MLQKWNTFKQSQNYEVDLQRMNLGIEKIREEWSKNRLQTAQVEFISREKQNARGKFGFWKELAADPQTTAADFELEIEQVPETISQFILGHFEKERSRLPQAEEMIRYFRSKHYPLIEHPSAASIQETETAYLDFLEDLPASLTEAMNHSGREIEAKHSDFLKTEGPKEFASLAESIEAHMPIRQSFFGEDGGKRGLGRTAVKPCPLSTINGYRFALQGLRLFGGRHFPRNRRNFVARTGSHDNSHRAWSFLRPSFWPNTESQGSSCLWSDWRSSIWQEFPLSSSDFLVSDCSLFFLIGMFRF